MPRFREGDYLFDGFAHRSFDEGMDGWRNAMPEPSKYLCVQQANSVMDLFEDLAAAKRRIWELEKEVARYKPLFDQATR
jgi:hypothetical protein